MLSGCEQEEKDSGFYPSGMKEGSQHNARTQMPMETSGRDSVHCFWYCGEVWKESSTIWLLIISPQNCSQQGFQKLLCVSTQRLYFNVHLSVTLSTINILFLLETLFLCFYKTTLTVFFFCSFLTFSFPNYC